METNLPDYIYITINDTKLLTLELLTQEQKTGNILYREHHATGERDMSGEICWGIEESPARNCTRKEWLAQAAQHRVGYR
ncbi:hypothetical protein [Deinococcus aerophilus]|nr:hypothetical protein [Deinococcus aerophilus]